MRCRSLFGNVGTIPPRICNEKGDITIAEFIIVLAFVDGVEVGFGIVYAEGIGCVREWG